MNVLYLFSIVQLMSYSKIHIYRASLVWHFFIQFSFEDAHYCTLKKEISGKGKHKSCQAGQFCFCTLSHLCLAFLFLPK